MNAPSMRRALPLARAGHSDGSSAGMADADVKGLRYIGHEML